MPAGRSLSTPDLVEHQPTKPAREPNAPTTRPTLGKAKRTNLVFLNSGGFCPLTLGFYDVASTQVKEKKGHAQGMIVFHFQSIFSWSCLEVFPVQWAYVKLISVKLRLETMLKVHPCHSPKKLSKHHWLESYMVKMSKTNKLRLEGIRLKKGKHSNS